VVKQVLNFCRTIIFVAGFTTFLTQCITYNQVPHSKKLSEVLVPQCTTKMSGLWNFGLWFLVLWIVWNNFLFLLSIPSLGRMHDFYLHLLEVPDSDMQTVSWQDIVKRLMALRDANPSTAQNFLPGQKEYMKKYLGSQSKQRLDAHDIANRLMRKENYLIALFNKEILDLTLPVPFLRGRQFFSRILEWTLHYSIIDLMFNEQGQVRQLVLKESHRSQLSAALRRRFIFAGCMNIVCSPIIVIYLLIIYFFKYFNVSPSSGILTLY
jgi:autophagy-related protein 9